MTLNRIMTDFFTAACLQQNESNGNDLSAWLHWTPMISDTDYATIQSLCASWKTAYDSNDLYGTKSDNSNYLVTGIGHFPTPPDRQH